MADESEPDLAVPFVLQNRQSLPVLNKNSSLLSAKMKGNLTLQRRKTIVGKKGVIDYDTSGGDKVPYYSQLLFQSYKRKTAFGQKEQKLSDAGSILTYKRQIVKNIKIEDTGNERRERKREAAASMR